MEPTSHLDFAFHRDSEKYISSSRLVKINLTHTVLQFNAFCGYGVELVVMKLLNCYSISMKNFIKFERDHLLYFKFIRNEKNILLFAQKSIKSTVVRVEFANLINKFVTWLS